MGCVKSSDHRGAPAAGRASSISTQLGILRSQASQRAMRFAPCSTRMAMPVGLALSLVLVTTPAFAEGGRGGGAQAGLERQRRVLWAVNRTSAPETMSAGPRRRAQWSGGILGDRAARGTAARGGQPA